MSFPHPNCPTPTAHKRLSEGHRWWHGCLENYDDVTAFKANLNACLQALRNVTFVLQKERRLIKDFDSWYPLWQSKMGADEIMKWLVKSRNRVVKEGDLELESTAISRVVFDYEGVADALKDSLPDAESDITLGRQMPPLTRPIDYASKIRSMPIAKHVMEGATLFVERRWVDSALPKRELLDALAHAFGVLSLLLEDAHSKAGIASVIAMDIEEGIVGLPRVLQHKGRLPCMVTTRESRTASYDILNGEILGNGRRYKVYPDSSMAERSRKRYGAIKLRQHSADTSFEEKIAYHCLDSAMSILERDKRHPWMVLCLKDGAIGDTEAYQPADRAEKLAVSRQIAEHVAVNGFTGVAVAAESWFSEIEHDVHGLVVEPAKAKTRREALMITVESKDGSSIGFTQLFRRRLRRIIWEELMRQDNSAYYRTLEPTRAIWKSWSKLGDGDGVSNNGDAQG